MVAGAEAQPGIQNDNFLPVNGLWLDPRRYDQELAADRDGPEMTLPKRCPVALGHTSDGDMAADGQLAGHVKFRQGGMNAGGDGRLRAGSVGTIDGYDGKGRGDSGVTRGRELEQMGECGGHGGLVLWCRLDGDLPETRTGHGQVEGGAGGEFTMARCWAENSWAMP
jgi:hypothetical protein